VPLYPYSCEPCEKQWESLISSDDRDKQLCPDCKAPASRRLVTGFAVNSEIDPKDQTVYSRNEIDKSVGKQADSSWESHENRTRVRREGKEIIELDITPGKFNPQELMGTKEQKELAKVNVEAFRGHKAAEAEKPKKKS
jgi:putative FmdB family regulatory protein